MLVKHIMSRGVVTIGPDATVEDAFAVMKQHDIRHLPVVENGRLVGLVTDRDVRGAIFPAMIEDLSVRDLMIANPITTQPDAYLEDAARLIYRYKIGCLPIVEEDGHLVSIITVADLLRSLIEVIGFISGSSRLDVVLGNKPEALEDAIRIIRDNGGRILGISQTSSEGGRQTHLFRLKKMDLDPIVKDMNEAGFDVVSSLS